MVKADLTEELILLASAGLSQLLKEEVALAGNRLEHRSQNAQVQQHGSTGRKILAEHQVDFANGSDHLGQSDTVDVTSIGNHSQAILNGIGVDLEQGHSVTPQAQVFVRSVLTVNATNHVGNVPQAESLVVHSHDIGSDSRHQTTSLVGSSIVGGLLVHAVDEGVLNVVVDLDDLLSHLKIQFVDGISLLIGDIHARQSTHVGLLGIGNANGLHEDLSHIGLLRTSHNGGFGSGQRSGFADRRLRTATGGILLTGHELNMIGDLGTTTDDSGQRGAGVALIKEHTGVIQNSEAGSNLICHFTYLLY